MTHSQVHHMTGSRMTVLAAGALTLLLTGSVVCGQWEQIYKLTAADGLQDDWFGCSVGDSDRFTVIGARGVDDVGRDAGAAYVFDSLTGEQLHKLTIADGDHWDAFGEAVAVSGSTVVVGASGYNHYYGAAFVFDALTGERLHKLVSEDGCQGDEFGSTVSVSGNTIVVGAPSHDWTTHRGAAYVFDAATGEQLHKLTAADGEDDDYFGNAVAVSGDTIVIGAWLDDDMGPYSGSAYVFDAVTGKQLHKITADDGGSWCIFGCSVAVSGDTVVIGACFDDALGSLAGAAYVFDATTGEQLHKIAGDDTEVLDMFGWSVSISGNTILLGTKGDDDAGSGAGAAYVFDATTGQQVQKLTADDGAAHDEFANSVSVHGDLCVIGAVRDDDGISSHPGGDSGAAYLFRWAGSL